MPLTADIPLAGMRVPLFDTDLTTFVLFFALRSLLAETLGPLAHAVLIDSSGHGTGAWDGKPISRTEVARSLQLNFKCNGKGNGVVYVSALPLKVVAQCGPDEANKILPLFCHKLMEYQGSPETASHHRELLRKAHPIWHHTTIEPLPTGQLRLRVKGPGLYLWLRSWLEQPGPDLRSADSGTTEPLTSLPLPPQLANRRLHLDPVVLMQYIYCRCSQLIQGSGAFRRFGVCPRKDHRSPDQPLGTMDRTREFWTALRCFVHLVDHLADPESQLKQLALGGHRLSAATEEWLSTLPNTQHFPNDDTLALLVGIQQALHHLLEARLGYALPQSL